jgi:hypothetical protein
MVADIKIEVSGPVNVTIGPTIEDIVAVKNGVQDFAHRKTVEALHWVDRCLKFL